MVIRCNNCFGEYDEKLGLCPFCGYAEGEPSTDAFCLSPGTIIADRYVIGEKVSSGGFGIVYKAWDKKLETIIAIKEYYPSGLVNRLPGETKVILVASKREREFVYGKTRFLEEARNMAKFSSHKNIVNVYHFFEENNTAYIVMEYLSGRTLSEVLQQQNVPLPYDYCVNVASEVCAALRAIHKEKILHRDVSPDNIMICNDGTVKLFDFGAARFSAGVENRVTVVVKPGFAPPEQYDKVNRQDDRTDIYALGATLYYAMTGTKPEESTNRKIEDTLVEPASIDNDIPKNISTTIMRAMAVEQKDRFPNVDEFEKALLSEKKVRSVEEERRRKKRRRTFGILLSLLIIVGAAGAFMHMYNAEKAEAGLPDADLEVWYIQTGVDSVDQAKASALNSILLTFTSEFSNVSVNLNPISYDSYAATLAEAIENGNAPAVFESTGITDISSENLANLGESLGGLEGISYYSDLLNSATDYPTGIVVPVIYMNTTVGSVVEEISNIDQLIETCKSDKRYFVVKESAVDLYATLFGTEIADYATAEARNEFFAREAFIYFGDSSDYLDVQNSLPGEYSLLMPSTENATYRNGTTWSVFEHDEDTTKSATALVTYLTSDLSQDYFHIQNQSGNLPIIKSSLAEFVSVYNELSTIEEYLSLPFVAPSENAGTLIENADRSKLEDMKSSPMPTFADVPDDAWYAEAVSVICSQGLMNGTTDTTFAPDAAINKLSVVTSLYRLAGSPTVMMAAPFTDVAADTEQGAAVAWAYENGIVSGTGDGLFNGSNPVNLETAMVLFLRFAEYLDLDLSTSIDLSIFSDASDVGSWASEGIQWALVHEILSTQEGGSIGPKAELTRGRYSVFLHRLMKELGDSSEDSSITTQSNTTNDPLAENMTKIPHTIVQKNLLSLSEEFTPYFTFYPDLSCDISLNMAEFMIELSGKYTVCKYDDGKRMISCDLGINDMGDGYGSRGESLVHFVETDGGDWLFYAGGIGLTATGNIFSPQSTDTTEVPVTLIHDENYEKYCGVWHRYVNNDTIPYGLIQIHEVEDGVILFDFDVYRFIGNSSQKAYIAPDGAAYCFMGETLDGEFFESGFFRLDLDDGCVSLCDLTKDRAKDGDYYHEYFQEAPNFKVVFDTFDTKRWDSGM